MTSLPGCNICLSLGICLSLDPFGEGTGLWELRGETVISCALYGVLWSLTEVLKPFTEGSAA